MTLERCDVCGAPREAGEPCSYCRSGGSVFSLSGLADRARRDGALLDSTIPALARDLDDALPGAVSAEWAHGLLGRPRNEVRRLSVDVGDERFVLEHAGRRYDGHIEMRVRGVTLKREEVPAGTWLDRLAAALSRSSQSTDAGEAMNRLLSR